MITNPAKDETVIIKTAKLYNMAGATGLEPATSSVHLSNTFVVVWTISFP